MSSADPNFYLEARIVLYSKNQWRLTGTLPANDIFRSYPQLFRHVTFVFNQRNLSPALKSHIWKMYAIRDRLSEECKATHEQCFREILRVSQWPQLLRAMKPHLNLVELVLREIRCPSGGNMVALCQQGGMFYKNYLACLMPTATVNGEKAEKRPRIGFWGTSLERKIIKSIFSANVPPESAKQPE